MRTVRFDSPVRLGVMPLEHAFNIAFSEATLRAVHGASLRLSEWKDDTRTAKFNVAMTNVPNEVKRMICGDSLRVTVRQSRSARDESIEVRNKVKLHFIGAELVSVRPVFEVTRNSDGVVHLNGWVDNVARLPLRLTASLRRSWQKTRNESSRLFDRHF